MKGEIANRYYLACMRLHEYVDDLYEECFLEDGDINYNIDQLSSKIHEYRKKVNIEIDLIKSSAIEYSEYDQKK